MSKQYTVNRAGNSVVEVGGSKFFGFAFPVGNRDEIDEKISRLRDDFSDCTHLIYAFRLGENGAEEYYTDAGEPAGTAGAPVIKILRTKNITDILVAIIRYFGGKKLGTGGLVRAYSETAKKAIENAKLITYIRMSKIRMKIPYGAVSQIAVFIDSIGGIMVRQNFEQEITLVAKVPQTKLNELKEMVADITRGKCKLEIIDGKDTL
ncbi:hypothetical protein DRQ33_05825 [bacterium]|nr:MAG: hypothetical protein DRQ33_05825 [bacterium]